MNLADLSIRDLVDRCLNSRDEDVWTEFVRRLQPLIAGVVVKTCHRCGVTDTHVMDDLVQEVFLKLCKDTHRVLRSCQIADEASFFGYLKVVTGNVVYDHCKYRSAERRNYLAEEALDGVSIAGYHTPAPELIGVDIDRILQEEKVPARDQSIFWLYFRQGFSAKEIAQSAGSDLSVKGVESCIYRLTCLLRERFAEAIAAKGGGR